MTAFIAYLRVSTRKQGRSGLGIDAQMDAVRRFITPSNCLLASFTEVESGKHDARPQLHQALNRCRLSGATLLIAKLDRLSRRVSFLSALMDSDVPFVAADNPHASRFTLHILAAVAEHEAEAISARTRAALAAAKARGKSLGGWRGHCLTASERKKGALVRSLAADARALKLAPIIRDMRACGASTLKSIADGLNARGIVAPRGGSWSASQVRAALLRGQRTHSAETALA